MKTTEDAYYFTISKLKEFKSEGIKINIKHCKSAGDIKMVQKYNLPGRVAPEHWVNVNLVYKNGKQRNLIISARKHLGMCGISFDTGGCRNTRDWELDWSFKYERGKEAWDWLNATEEVEEIIQQHTH